jgi:hypothetical protein
MSDQRQKSGARRASRRWTGRAAAVVVSSVALLAVAATPAFAKPVPDNPPAPTGTVSTNGAGAVTVAVTGSWSWSVGTGAGELNATAASPCGGRYGVGWGIVWNDATDPGYELKYGKVAPEYVGSTLAIDGNTVDEAVHYDASAPCGTYSANAITGTWSDSHVYANASSVPKSICVVSYILRKAPKGHPRQYKVDKNKRNSFHVAVRQGNGAAWPTSSACFDPASLKASPTIVTTATNAQVGSPITDSAALSGTSDDLLPIGAQSVAVTGNAATGDITFTLYSPTDTNCTSTPVYTSAAIPVSGNGTYGPVSFTPTQGPGTYRWIASYSGDPANNGATELCGAAGETSTVTAAPATSSSNPSTNPTSSVPVVATAALSNTTPETAVAGATTVHTGEPWAGSKPFVVGLIAFGLSLMGLGYFERRRVAVRKHAENNTLSTD